MPHDQFLECIDLNILNILFNEVGRVGENEIWSSVGRGAELLSHSQLHFDFQRLQYPLQETLYNELLNHMQQAQLNILT